MAHQVRDSYLPFVFPETNVLHSNTDKVTDKDLPPVMVVVTAVPVATAADSLSHHPLVPLQAPIPSTFDPYPPLSTIVD